MSLTKEQIAHRIARELKDGYYVNLGIGIPTLVANYIPAGIKVVLQSENGLLGIFALIISFTMITSGNYVRERTDCIHEEADELALIFRTSKFYNDTLRTRVHSYLREFLRIQLTNRAPSISECATLIDSMEMNDRELDDFLVRYAQQNLSTQADAKALIPLVERARSKYYLLLYSFMERTPVPIMLTLIILCFAIAFLIGFMNAFHETKNYMIPFIFFVVTVMMIDGIRDLDNPKGGFITPHYEDLLDVQKLIKRGY